jgi:hypothetical protein
MRMIYKVRPKITKKQQAKRKKIHSDSINTTDDINKLKNNKFKIIKKRRNKTISD